MTVAGRTDEMHTGIFTVWQLDGQKLTQAWASDLLSESSYEADSSGVHLTYCADQNEDNPDQCARMVRASYSWEDGAWKPGETKVLAQASGGH